MMFGPDTGQTSGARMKKHITAVFIGLTVLFPQSSSAYFDTGNALFTMCQSTNPFDMGSCLGTIIGHYDMMMSQGYDCGADTTKNKQQLRDIMVKYLRDNPNTRNQPSATLSFFAFLFAFDCKLPEPVQAKKP